LAGAIAALRLELLEAWRAGAGERLRFRPAPVELTLQVAVTREGKVDAGVRWWVVSAGGEASRGSTVTQTVKLTLDPVFVDERGRVDPNPLIDDLE
jgi:hypothetical protein